MNNKGGKKKRDLQKLKKKEKEKEKKWRKCIKASAIIGSGYTHP
jgi:hypothetical protein